MAELTDTQKAVMLVHAILTRMRTEHDPAALLRMTQEPLTMPDKSEVPVTDDMVWEAINQCMTEPFRPLVDKLKDSMSVDHARMVLVFICLAFLQGSLQVKGK